MKTPVKMAVITVISSFGVGSPAAHATEPGAGMYPNGAENFMVGAAPPPGWYFVNYTNYYNATKLADNNGHKAVPFYRLTAVADVFRTVYSSPHEIAGGNWGTQLFVPLVHLDVNVNGSHNSKSGLGDLTYSNFVAWHTKNFHWLAAVDVDIPVGAYNKDDLANPGSGFWQIEPVLAGTYLSDGGTEVSAKVMYRFSLENNDTNYQSGQMAHTDFTVAQHFGDLAVGVGGYALYQTTNDERNGVMVAVDGNKGQAFALGPQIKYDVKGLQFIGSWNHEFEARNRPEGDKLWLKIVGKF